MSKHIKIKEGDDGVEVSVNEVTRYFIQYGYMGLENENIIVFILSQDTPLLRLWIAQLREEGKID